MTPEMFMAEAQRRIDADPEFRARVMRGKLMLESFLKNQHLGNRPDLVGELGVAMGVLMAEANIEAVISGEG